MLDNPQVIDFSLPADKRTLYIYGGATIKEHLSYGTQQAAELLGCWHWQVPAMRCLILTVVGGPLTAGIALPFR